MNHIAGFITGHSVPGYTGLSREQRDFQSRSVVPEKNWLRHNFPWKETFPYPKSFNLVSGSWNNVRHYLASRRRAFRVQHRMAVIERFAPHDQVLLLAGSCGLELLNNLHLPEETRRRLHVFAYGPVCRSRPDVASLFVVQGSRDFLSRAFHRRADARFTCSHMSYLEAPETLHLLNLFYRRVVAL
jgi:hypothetical protein